MLLKASLLALVLTQTSAEKPKVIVLELSAAGDVPAEVAGAMTEAMTSQLASRGLFEVMGAREVQTLISVERQRQLIGCSDEGTSCMSELAGALGARFVLGGTLAKLGDSYQLTLQMLDSQKSQTVGRATRIAPTLDALRAVLPWAIADATGTPPPPRPSNVLSYSMVLGGALALAGGGVVGFTALSDEGQIARELVLGTTREGVLKSASFYREEAVRIERTKIGSAAAMGVGAALILGGVLAYQRDPVSDAGADVALVPTTRGVALVGVLP